MKYTVRITIAVLTFACGTAAVLLWLAWRTPHHQPPSVEVNSSIIPERKIYFRFLECAGEKSVFLLENQTDHPIYAQVQRVDYWLGYKDSAIELGVHFVERVTPNPPNAEGGRSAWDAPPPFRMIPPYSSVRYGVDLSKGEGEYRVKVPYMEDGEIARRLNEDFASVLRHDFELVRASWREVSSDTNTNRCQ
jgi:hypothetical protein